MKVSSGEEKDLEKANISQSLLSNFMIIASLYLNKKQCGKNMKLTLKDTP